MNAKDYNEILEVLNELVLDNVEQLKYSEPKFKFEYAFESLTEHNSKYRKRISHA